MTLNRIQFIFLFLLGAVSISHATDWEDMLSQEIAEKLSAQIKLNERNQQTGLQKANNYVVELSGDEWESKSDWIKETGESELRIFTDADIKAFNSKLVAINEHQKLTTAQSALYVVVINNWKLVLKTTLTPGDKITSLAQLGTRARQKSREDLEDQMARVPVSVEAQIKSEKGRNTIYVYLFSRFLVYDNPDDVKAMPKAFTYVSFPESDVRKKLKGVNNLGSLSKKELISQNIDIFGKHFIDGSSDVSLAFNYTIPENETTLVDAALKKDIRKIAERPNDPQRSVYDYSNLISDEAKLKALEQVCADLRKGSEGGTPIFLKTFYTDYRMDIKTIDEIWAYTSMLAKNDMMIWIHLKEGQEVTAQLFFGTGLEERVTKDFLDHTVDFTKQYIKVYHKLSSIPVKAVAWLAGGLGKVLSTAKIDSTYYDPSLGDKYDGRLCVLYYIGRTSTTFGSGAIGKTIVSDDDDFGKKIVDGFKQDFSEKVYEFAFITGVWNGVFNELLGVTDAIKMLCEAYTDPPAIEQVNLVLESIFNGKAFTAIRQQLKDRYSTGIYSEYRILHHSAQDMVAVAALFVGVGELAGAAKVSQTFAKIAKAAQALDLMYLSRYVARTVQGLKLYRMSLANTKYFIAVVQHQSNLLLKLTNDVGQVLKNTDLSLMRQVSVQLEGGAAMPTIVFMDPTDNLKGALRDIHKLAEDAYGNRMLEMTDDAGKHIGVEVKNAAHLVDDAAELATLLARAEGSLPTPALKAAFRSDFSENMEMLRLFDKNPEWVNSWRVLHDNNLKSFIKTDPDRLAVFHKLSPENQILVAKFTDETASSSLAKFMDDCEDDFIKLLNDDPKYVECFLSHRSSDKWTIDQFEELAESIYDNGSLTNIQKTKLNKWLDHSSDASKFGKVAQKGIDLSSNIYASLSKRSGKLFDDLAAKLGIDPGILKQYEVYSEVPLNTEGGFMKADVVFVKRNGFDKSIDDVIVIENKLSAGTDFTVRQKEGWKKLANRENLNVKSTVYGKGANGVTVELNSTHTITSNKVKAYKIHDHGETDIANTIISEIPVDNWKNYSYIPTK